VERPRGWSFYLTGVEVAFEVLVRMIVASLAGLLLGTVATASIAPILWYLKSRCQRLADWATKAVVLAVVFVLSRHALLVLIEGAAGSWSHTLMFSKVSLLAFYLAFDVEDTGSIPSRSACQADKKSGRHTPTARKLSPPL
jgi:hypothetical protein